MARQTVCSQQSKMFPGQRLQDHEPQPTARQARRGRRISQSNTADDERNLSPTPGRRKRAGKRVQTRRKDPGTLSSLPARQAPSQAHPPCAAHCPAAVSGSQKMQAVAGSKPVRRTDPPAAAWPTQVSGSCARPTVVPQLRLRGCRGSALR